mmetsp:Transcript_21906/g.47654  ORF Transcript_21906/g.47654 Transcript_21906/m.47654 type:complete len:119 (+) Transcript_21906:611-967(+)
MLRYPVTSFTLGVMSLTLLQSSVLLLFTMSSGRAEDHRQDDLALPSPRRPRPETAAEHDLLEGTVADQRTPPPRRTPTATPPASSGRRRGGTAARWSAERGEGERREAETGEEEEEGG